MVRLSSSPLDLSPFLRSLTRPSHTVYDKKASEEILRTVAENHGIELSSVKSDLYTILGLDSKVSSPFTSFFSPRLDDLVDLHCLQFFSTNPR